MIDSPFLVKRFIDMGADPNQLNKRRRAPLHLGVKYVRRMCVVELLEGAANPDVVDDKDNTPLYYTKGSNSVKWLRWFAANIAHTNFNGENLVHYLIRKSSTDAAVRIIESPKFKRHLLDRDNSGDSLLHIAVRIGDNTTTQKLLDNAVDIAQMCAIRNNLDQTPLAVAILAKQVASFHMLCAHLDFFRKGPKGKHPVTSSG